MIRQHRRGFIRSALTVGGSAVAFAGLGTGPASRTSRAAGQSATPAFGAGYAAEVETGLAYLRHRATEHSALADQLLTSIAAGDPEAAQAAYVAVRPPYEEIEVLAASFPETDEAIDARPAAIEGGETSPDYVSVHHIESLLYRDDDLAAAMPLAHGFVESARRLERDLTRREAFTPVLSFAGMIGLANEIASKKISSEEETWSDQSLLIFHFNWIGIRSQYDPFAPAVVAVDPEAAAAVDAAHEVAMGTIAPYPPAADGVFPPFSAVPMAERGAIVRAGYAYRDALVAAAETLGIA